LTQAWPKDFYKRYQYPWDTDSAKSTTREKASAAEHEPSDHLAAHAGPKIPSLVDLALGRAIHQCTVDGGEGIEHLEHIVDLPGKAAILFAGLKKTSSFSGQALGFLQKLIKRTGAYPKSVDISGYRLTGKQIAQVLDSSEEITSLNVSHNSKMTKDDLLHILRLLPNLVYLNVIATPLSNNDLSSILEMKPTVLPRIQAIIHPLLTDKDHSFHRTFGFRVGRATVTLPLLSLDSVVQMMWNFCELLLKPEASPRGSRTLHFPSVAIVASGFRHEGALWDDRAVPFLPKDWVTAMSEGTKGMHFIFHFNYKQRTYGIITRKQKTSTKDGEADREVIAFSTFLSRLESEGLSRASDLATVQNLTDIVKGMTLVSLSGYFEDCRSDHW
jgi:hypothetical protein